MVLKKMTSLINGLWNLRPDMNLFKDEYADTFVTTFSNSPCFSNYCLRQSYPDLYPYENNTKTGSIAIDL